MFLAFFTIVCLQVRVCSWCWCFTAMFAVFLFIRKHFWAIHHLCGETFYFWSFLIFRFFLYIQTDKCLPYVAASFLPIAGNKSKCTLSSFVCIKCSLQTTFIGNKYAARRYFTQFDDQEHTKRTNLYQCSGLFQVGMMISILSCCDFIFDIFVVYLLMLLLEWRMELWVVVWCDVILLLNIITIGREINTRFHFVTLQTFLFKSF